MTPFRWFLTVLSFAAAIGGSWYVVASEWPVGGAPLGLPWWAHLAALGVVGLELFFRATKIHFSAQALGLPLTLATSARTCMGGDFAAAITPSRSGAEPARFLVLSEAGVPVPSILIVLFLELFLEMLSLLIVVGGFVAFLDHSGQAIGAMLGLVGGYATLLLSAVALALLLARRNLGGPPPRWARALGVKAGLWRRVQRSLRHVRAGAAALKTARRGVMSLALAASVLHVLARLAILPVLVYAYGERPPLSPLLVWPLALLYGSAVAPAPAGGGVVEFGFRAALGGVISPRLMGASLIWWRVYSFYIYLVLGALAAGRTVMRALRRSAEVLDAET